MFGWLCLTVPVISEYPECLDGLPGYLRCENFLSYVWTFTQDKGLFQFHISYGTNRVETAKGLFGSWLRFKLIHK